MTPIVAVSTQLLVQFLATVASCPDEMVASRVAAEHVAAAFEAEVAAVLIDDVFSTVGFPQGRIPRQDLLEIADQRLDRVMVPGAGWCAAMVAPLKGRSGGHLLVARFGDEGFTAEESNLLRGMARTLDLVLVMLRTLEAEHSMRELSDHHAQENAALLTSLQQRHRLLEELMGIQRAISRREPLSQVLDSIVSSFSDLLGADEVACLCLLSRDDARGAGMTFLGLPQDKAAALRLTAAADCVGSDAIANDAVAVSPLVADGKTDMLQLVAMAAPVHENGHTVGALVVGSPSPTRRYTGTEEATLAAFAEHVSLAITDAHTLEDVRQAHHDPLTGLAGRRLFMDRLQQVLLRASRTLTPVALLFIDLDRFKMVNDTRGHHVGDILLTEIAARVTSCLRADDTAGRLGGDEFVVVLQDSGRTEQALEVAQRVLAAVRRPMLLEGHQVFVDASIGLATALPNDTDADGLLRDADVAMYEAKRAGSGRIAIFDPSMRDRVETRVELEADLRHALDAGELQLNYQPMIDIASGRVVSVEALLQWAHPTRGVLAPMSFVPMAEETRLILPVGDWVLREACRQASLWRDLFGSGEAPSISVNLSGRQLQEPDIAHQVARAIDFAQFDARAVILEITESVLLDDGHGVLARLNELKALGVRLAVDDFGAGFSSLSHLRIFPIDILKVDKTFIDAITCDPQSANLARAIIALGDTMHLQTVAQGIETGEQLRLLRAAGCDLAQGPFVSRPLDGQAIRSHLLAQRTDRASFTPGVSFQASPRGRKPRPCSSTPLS